MLELVNGGYDAQLMIELLWRAPAGGELFGLLMRAVNLNYGGNPITTRVRNRLGDTTEFHALAPEWQGSIDALVRTIRTARAS